MCEICKHNPCLSRCPNYIPKRTEHICCYCNDYIYIGDEFVMNENGEYIHRDCIPSIGWLITWVDLKAKVMEEE